MHRQKKGFTLMEMLIVVAIIGILVAIAIPTFTDTLHRARETTCIANRRSLQALLAVEQMLTQAEDLEAVSKTAQGEAWMASFVCPSGGEITVRKNLILCSKHGKTASTVTAVQDDFRNIMETWTPEMGYPSNDKYRAEYLKQHGSWPKMKIGVTEYYVQPYYDKANESVCIFGLEGEQQTWFTFCIYDAEEGVWYTGKKGISLVDKSWASIESEMTKQNWKSTPATELYP